VLQPNRVAGSSVPQEPTLAVAPVPSFEGRPLPDPTETRCSGLVGFEIELPPHPPHPAKHGNKGPEQWY